MDFIIFSNAAGNAVAFAIYVVRAAGLPDDSSAIRGVVIAAITAACLLHASWRKGGILLNNAITVIKVAILLLIIVLGFAARAGASFGHGRIQTTTFDVHTSFANPRGGTATYANSFIYVLGAYNGFRQPFYVSVPGVPSNFYSVTGRADFWLMEVLNEVRRPRKTFARSTILAMIVVSVLYVLVNVAYVWFSRFPLARSKISDFNLVMCCVAGTAVPYWS